MLSAQRPWNTAGLGAREPTTGSRSLLEELGQRSSKRQRYSRWEVSRVYPVRAAEPRGRPPDSYSCDQRHETKLVISSQYTHSPQLFQLKCLEYTHHIRLPLFQHTSCAADLGMCIFAGRAQVARQCGQPASASLSRKRLQGFCLYHHLDDRYVSSGWCIDDFIC